MGVTAVDIEDIVGKVVSTAMAVIHDEFTKLISDIQTQLQSVKDRLAVVETTDSTSSFQKETERLERAIEGMQQEMRQHAVAANDAAQYLRWNNIRIKSLSVKEGEDCRRIVTEFVRKDLHEPMTEDGIEVAHTVPIPACPILTISPLKLFAMAVTLERSQNEYRIKQFPPYVYHC